MKEQFLEILGNGDKEKITPFMLQLTEKERKTLMPVIISETERLSKIIDYAPNRRGPLGTPDQREVLKVSRFFCMDKKAIMKISKWSFPTAEELNDLLSLYTPEWFADYINQLEFFTLPYSMMLDWMDKGYVSFTTEFIVNSLVEGVSDENRKQGTPLKELLLANPVTLETYIWYIFKYPTNINWKNTEVWCNTLKELGDEKKLDRMQLIKESLLAINRNFNKTQTGWFVDLFVTLAPTHEELLIVQEELLAALTSVHTKPVSRALDAIKKIITDKSFHMAGFIPLISLLVSSETKAIVTATLGVLQTLLKTNSPYQQEICHQLVSIFISKDETIQKKGATLFLQYAEPDEELMTTLQGMEENLFSSVKSSFQSWLPETDTKTESSSQTIDFTSSLPLIRKETQIEYPQTFEEFAFFLNQAVTLEQPYYLDVFMQSLIAWANQTQAKGCVLLEPVIKKVCKSLDGWGHKSPLIPMGNLLYEYCLLLEKKYPSELKKIMGFWTKLLESEHVKRRNASEHSLTTGIIKDMKIPAKLRRYKGFYQIAITTQQKIQSGDTLPLLSTPTHTPIWIDPVTLVKRIALYQEAEKEPDTMDMQLAIQRCALDDTTQALKLAKKELKGELKELMCFLLDKQTQPKGEFTHRAWWTTAAITRSPDMQFKAFDSFEYKAIPTAFLTGDHTIESYVEKNKYGDYKRVRMTTPAYKLRGGNPLLIEYFFASTNHANPYAFNIHKEDVPFLLFSVPNRPDILTGFIGEFLINYLWEVQEKEIGLATITYLSQLEIPFRKMDILFLAGSILCMDKTIRDYTAQVWIERTYTNQLDSWELGKAIGKIEYLEIHPLKRLTDQILSSMWNISDLHNRALIEMIEGILSESNPEPIKNMKKLLEIYSELLVLTGSKPSLEKTPLLKEWKNNKGLKKIVENILK